MGLRIEPKAFHDAADYFNRINLDRRLPEGVIAELVLLALGGKLPELPHFVVKASERPKLSLVYFSDITLKDEPPALVEGLLDHRGMSVVYGPSGVGKSFFALDLAYHIAAGREWRGRKVEAGVVVYVAAEDPNGIQRRLLAIGKKHNINATDLPIAVLPCPINLHAQDGDTGVLVALIKEAGDHFNLPVRLVVVDTLARTMGAGNENTTEDMGVYVQNVDAIRAATGGHTAIIHHSGKDQTKGARGSSSLRAATDTEIELTRGQAVVTKQRNMSTEGQKFYFGLETVTIGADRTGMAISSAVVVESGTPSPVTAFTPQVQGVFEALQFEIERVGGPAPKGVKAPPGAVLITIEAWRKCAYSGTLAGTDPAAQRKAFGRARDKIGTSGLIGFGKEYVWLTDSGTLRDIAGHVATE